MIFWISKEKEFRKKIEKIELKESYFQKLRKYLFYFLIYLNIYISIEYKYKHF